MKGKKNLGAKKEEVVEAFKLVNNFPLFWGTFSFLFLNEQWLSANGTLAHRELTGEYSSARILKAC